MHREGESATTSAPFNMAEMRRQLGDDDALVTEVVQLFLDDCPSRMATLAAALEKSDAPQVRRAAHTIKGAASNFFATAVVETAAAIEMKAAGGDLTGIDDLARRLDAEMKRLVAAMTDIRSAAERQ